MATKTHSVILIVLTIAIQILGVIAEAMRSFS